jgi:hypothetical protein
VGDERKKEWGGAVGERYIYINGIRLWTLEVMVE